MGCDPHILLDAGARVLEKGSGRVCNCRCWNVVQRAMQQGLNKALLLTAPVRASNARRRSVVL